MKLWIIFLFIVFSEVLVQNGDCHQAAVSRPQQNAKIKQNVTANRKRTLRKRLKSQLAKTGNERNSLKKSQKTIFIMTQVLAKGQFRKPSGTLTLTAGQSVELRCKGSNIGWSYPVNLNDFKDPRLSITHQEKYSQLVLSNATAADTGAYSCWAIVCDGLECYEDNLRMGKTYIFFTDPTELFVPSSNYFEIVYLQADKPSTIPCRSSSPSAKVTLHQGLPPQQIPVDGRHISYVSKEGFIIHQPRPEQKGVVYCMASLRGVLQISNNYLLLYVEAPRGPPSTTIGASSNKVSYGDELNITCKVLGEPDVQVTFTWKYPGQPDERPVIITNKWRLINQDRGLTTRLSQSVLYIDDVETIDIGDYICSAQNPMGQTVVATRVVSHVQQSPRMLELLKWKN